MALIRHSRPDSGIGSQVKSFETFYVVPSRTKADGAYIDPLPVPRFGVGVLFDDIVRAWIHRVVFHHISFLDQLACQRGGCKVCQRDVTPAGTLRAGGVQGGCGEPCDTRLSQHRPCPHRGRQRPRCGMLCAGSTATCLPVPSPSPHTPPLSRKLSPRRMLFPGHHAGSPTRTSPSAVSRVMPAF